MSDLKISNNADGNAFVTYGDTSIVLEGVNSSSVDSSSFMFSPQEQPQEVLHGA